MIEFIHQVKAAYLELNANKTRSMLTALGMVIAIGGVITIVGIVYGFERSLVKEFKVIGNETIIVGPNIYKWMNSEYVPPLTINEWRALKNQVNGIKNVVAFSIVPISDPDGKNGTISYLDKKITGKILATTDRLPQLTGRFPLQGRFIVDSDSDKNRPVCLVSKSLITKLGLPDNPINSRIRVGSIWLDIVGVMPGDSSDILATSADIYLPFGTANQITNDALSLRLGFEIADIAEYKHVLRSATASLRRSQHTPPHETDNFHIEDASEIQRLSKVILNKTTNMLLLVSFVSLLVGSIGIMNVMLVSVNERTREIGLMRALGATQKYIKKQILIESALLCFGGAVVGIMVGWILSQVIVLGNNNIEHAVIPLWTAATSITISVLIGILCGVAPARKAAALDPVTALTTE
ncbi:ABC transporter permease [Psychrobium sp. nBUS_13]|uniref:ABC transporter permease n=1 Tax=Psychrobium sp. nBUS_13 TaxID=3395319 RepID=UPI003EBC39E7